MRALTTGLALAWKSLRRGHGGAHWLAFAIAASIAPLLVLFGLKTGAIEMMLDTLRADPRNLEIKLVGSGRFDEAWFRDLADAPGVGFLMPVTRQIAASAVVTSENADRGAGIKAELVPTALGDPLHDHGIADPLGAVVLSHRLAERLEVAPGNTVTLLVTRTLEGRREAETLGPVVAGIVPRGLFVRPAVFADPALLLAIEHYRDGLAVPALGVSGQADPPDRPVYAGFRLYATDLLAVAPLAALLSDRGLEVRARLREIETVLALDNNLTAIFWIIAGAVGVGAIVSLASTLWAEVGWQTKDLGTLRLLGVPRAGIVLFPAWRALLTGVLGVAIAVLIAFATQGALNLALSDPGGNAPLICRIGLGHIAAAGGLTVIASGLAALMASIRAAGIEPFEAMVDE